VRKWLGLLVGLMLCLPVCGAEKAPSLAVEQPPVRALHFVLRAVPLDKAYWLVDEAKAAGFNTIIVTVTDGVALNTAPWGKKPGAWSREEFKSWVEHAQRANMKVVPELKLLSHQDKFFQNGHPALMFNSLTYDPVNPFVYEQIVFPMFDELVRLIKPKAIHIGHDEVAGFANEILLPAALFLQDVERIYGYLERQGIETWMWGDMLISPDEFPEMKPNPLHGRTDGYGKVLRQQLPKDIVICDWHYSDDQEAYPSSAAFKAEGFRVLGATWKKEKTIRNFSRYAAQHGADGMIATTWFHVQRKEWDVVERIIRTSGRIFSKDFPDVQ